MLLYSEYGMPPHQMEYSMEYRSLNTGAVANMQWVALSFLANSLRLSRVTSPKMSFLASPMDVFPNWTMSVAPGVTIPIWRAFLAST